MRNKKKLHIFALLCLGLLATVSCIKEEWGVGNISQEKGGGAQTWNKNKTIEVYFLSELEDKAVKEVSAISSFFKDKGALCTLGVIDRTDVNTAYPPANPSTQIAFETARFSSFALNKINAPMFEGSTILFNHKINSEKAFRVTDDCWVKYISIQASTATAEPIKIQVPFGTVRFSSKEQIEAAKSTLALLSGNEYEALIIGTVKTDLVPDLENVSKNISGYALTQATKKAETEYSIFVFGPKSWVLREMTKTPVSGNLHVFCLSVEASVE